MSTTVKCRDYFRMFYFLSRVEADIDLRCFSKYALNPLNDSTAGIALLFAFQTHIHRVKSVELLSLITLYFS